jgi:hypothetical protein
MDAAVVDQFGSQTRSIEAVEPLSRTEIALGVGGLAVSFIGTGEGTLITLVPMLGYQLSSAIVILLAVQSAIFVVLGLGMSFYALIMIVVAGLTNSSGNDVSLEHAPTEREVLEYATRFYSVSLTAHWRPNSAAAGAGFHASGLSIYVNDLSDIPDDAAFLKRTLESLGLTVAYQQDQNAVNAKANWFFCLGSRTN